MSRMRSVRALVTASALSVALMLGGGGDDETAADRVPTLGDRLEEVDDAIVDGEYDAARESLDELVRVATRAEDDGDLGAREADRILAAAAELAAALQAQDEEPEEEPEDTETPTPSPTPTPTPTEESTPTPALTPTEEPTEPTKPPSETPTDLPVDPPADGQGEGTDG